MGGFNKGKMKELVFDVMLDGCFIKTFRYKYNPLFPIDGNELSKFVEDKLPTLKGKPYSIALSNNKPIKMVF